MQCYGGTDLKRMERCVQITNRFRFLDQLLSPAPLRLEAISASARESPVQRQNARRTESDQGDAAIPEQALNPEPARRSIVAALGPRRSCHSRTERVARQSGDTFSALCTSRNPVFEVSSRLDLMATIETVGICQNG